MLDVIIELHYLNLFLILARTLLHEENHYQQALAYCAYYYRC